MAWWTTLGAAGAGTVGGVAVAVVGVAAVVGYVFVYPQFVDDDDATPEVVVSVPAEPEVTTAAPDPAQEQQIAEPQAEPTTPPPAFDVVRIDGDGNALIAGMAPAGASVEVLVDGVAINTSVSGNDGRFVAMFDLPGSEKPRSLQLAALKDGKEPLLSEQTVLVAPFGAVQPEQLAVATPELETVESTQSGSGGATTVAQPVRPATPAPLTTPQAKPQAPQLVIADASGVRPLQPVAAPAAPTPDPRDNVIIDTISYSAAGEVELTGRGTAGDFVRIYLDNAVILDGAIDALGSWSVVLPGVNPGIYTLRVDELDATGAVHSRFETPFKREDPVLLARLTEGLEPPAEVEETAVDEAPVVETQPAVVEPVVTEAPAAPATPAPVEVAVVEQPAPVEAPAPEAVAQPAAPAAVTEADTAPTTPLASVITVQPGFTLWQIARERFGEGELYVHVYEANKEQIKNPDRIFPGQVFSIPDVPGQ